MFEWAVNTYRLFIIIFTKPSIGNEHTEKKHWASRHPFVLARDHGGQKGCHHEM